MAGKLEQFYTEALARYKEYKYPDFHRHIAWKMTDWYKRFQLDTKAVDVEDESAAEAVEEGAVVVAPPVVANGAAGAFTTSPSASEEEGGEDGRGGEGGEG